MEYHLQFYQTRTILVWICEPEMPSPHSFSIFIWLHSSIATYVISFRKHSKLLIWIFCAQWNPAKSDEKNKMWKENWLLLCSERVYTSVRVWIYTYIHMALARYSVICVRRTKKKIYGMLQYYNQHNLTLSRIRISICTFETMVCLRSACVAAYNCVYSIT